MEKGNRGRNPVPHAQKLGQNWEGSERSSQKLPSESLGMSHTGRTFRMYTINLQEAVLVVPCQKHVPSSPANFYEDTTWLCRQDFSSFVLKT